MTNKTMDNVKTVNSAIRTMVMLAFLGIFGYLGWVGYEQWIRPGLDAQRMKDEMAALQVKFEAQKERLIKTQTALRLVKVDHRRATIKVVEKGLDEQSEEPFFIVQFTEIDDDGLPLSEAREFRLRGSIMFVDSWIVKFDDKYVEEADPLRSTSLCLFKSIYGDIDERSGGHELDQNDPSIATAYGTRDPKNEFEQQIWDQFWELANNSEMQQELGIRANHGNVSYIQVLPGMVYQVDLRASDGITLKAVEQTQNTSTLGPSGG